MVRTSSLLLVGQVLVWKDHSSRASQAEPCVAEFGDLKVQAKHPHSWTILKELKPLVTPHCHGEHRHRAAPVSCWSSQGQGTQHPPSLAVAIETEAAFLHSDAGCFREVPPAWQAGRQGSGMSWLAGRAAMAEARLCQASPGASVPKSTLSLRGVSKNLPFSCSGH